MNLTTGQIGVTSLLLIVGGGLGMVGSHYLAAMLDNSDRFLTQLTT